MELVFATANKNKMKEVSRMLPNEIEIIGLPDVGILEDIPETSDSIQGNALQKARYVYEKTGKNCFADDTGLEVDALNGAPGVHSARYATDGHDHAANVALLLKNLSGITDRSARFRTVIALIVDGKEYLFEGIVEGRITEYRSGEGGFGYDPVFVPEDCNETFAQMSEQMKNSMSHRGRATRKLVDFLKSSFV